MERNQRKKRSDAEYNQQMILTTMEDLLEQGEDISTKKMSDLAKLSGVGVGTLYRHFESKSLLCQAIMDKKVDQMFIEIEDILSKNEHWSVRDKIYTILSKYLDLKEANFTTLNFMEKSSEHFNSIINIPFFERLKNLLSEQFEEDMYTDDLDFRLNLMLNSFSSDFYYFVKHNQQLTKDQFLTKLLDLFQI
ncbi:TetR/AcrR family transcriptional regulator [Staphylococcus pasteuri]|uniref:TetR/AcrR family transcriptional regulator n=1 Tax=Staphylococcus pasteuri TaxID=45972 RepID=UPI002DB84797|nr:TetR/AcrR family transcriptional regulator [Staphylococcus pasteuri]MEB7434510.1 TetR/AcrR family transcriptional regulator [Staphylococcus pasteuri]